jgi:MOSC domain-containing protein YiiM
MIGQVVAVARSERHGFSKQPTDSITLRAGLGVEGDAHLGVTVQHLSRIAVDPTQPNLRQVHLIHRELFDELNAKGFRVSPGDLGENITTRDVALLDLPTGTLLTLGDGAIIEVTGLRNPCAQIERFEPGLLAAVLDKGPGGELIRKSGIMGIVIKGGTVRPGDGIKISLPAAPHRRLDRV